MEQHLHLAGGKAGEAEPLMVTFWPTWPEVALRLVITGAAAMAAVAETAIRHTAMSADRNVRRVRNRIWTPREGKEWLSQASACKHIQSSELC